MRKRVRITSGKDDVVELDVKYLRIDENRYELEYSDTESSTIRIKAGKESLCLQRDGDGINTQLYFKHGERLNGKAVTPYGVVPVSTLTNYLKIEDTVIRLDYVIEGNEDTRMVYVWEILEAKE